MYNCCRTSSMSRYHTTTMLDKHIHSTFTTAMESHTTPAKDSASSSQTPVNNNMNRKSISAEHRELDIFSGGRKPAPQYTKSEEDIKHFNNNNAWCRSRRENICCAHLDPSIGCACTSCTQEAERLHLAQATFWSNLGHD